MTGLKLNVVGQKQRVAIAVAVLRNPRVSACLQLVARPEETNGLDCTGVGAG